MIRVGVVGGGLVAQAMHIPNLAALPDRFQLAALAEPSATVREALGARYGIAGLHADYRALLDAGGLDAVVVCSPAGTHAEVVLAALDAGLHVFVEKPMCITLADADAIVAARDRAGRVVQVGTMKRFDPAVERMLAELPDSADDLRYVSVVVNDPEFEPYFGPGEIVRGGDVPQRSDRRDPQGRGGAGRGGGRLGRPGRRPRVLGELPRQPAARPQRRPRAARAHGRAAAGRGRRAATGGTRAARSTGSVGSRTARAADSAWIQLLDTLEYRETISLFFADSVRTLTFPSPWLRQHPTVYRRSERDGTAELGADRHVLRGVVLARARALPRVHRRGTPCRTPPEQARLDIDVLTQMFLASR